MAQLIDLCAITLRVHGLHERNNLLICVLKGTKETHIFIWPGGLSKTGAISYSLHLIHSNTRRGEHTVQGLVHTGFVNQ